MTMTDFLDMGGYALWVWSAYGLTVLVMVANVILARSRLRRSTARLRARAGRLARSATR